MIGKRINDRYQILETIGGGGMANVYKAHDVILNRKVAVKVLRPQFSDDDDFIRRFRREAQAATSLSHPNVVNIYDVGEENQVYYIVMEYVSGLTLKQLIQQRGALPIEETINIMSQILSAISHAHLNQIVHRDIKPHNILISKKGEAKVTDFGIARAMTSATITHTNSVMGSVHYLSPEQARGGLVNERSDIYSLGIVLYEMVTGRVPFHGDTAVSIAIKHLQSELPAPKVLNPTLPQSIENIILKATAKDPFHRYRNVKEMEGDLITALDPRRMNEEKFVVPIENDDVTKAIPIVREGYTDSNLEETKIPKPSGNGNTNGKTQVQEKKPKKKWIPILSGIFLAIVTLFIAAFLLLPKLLHVEEVTIPDNLIEEKFEDAAKVLEDLGLEVEKEEVPHKEIAEGLVVNHTPGPAETVKVGSTITLFVSTGKDKIPMVNIKEMTRDVAERTLLNLGFKEENIVWKTEENDRYEDGTVIFQMPLPETLVIPEDESVIVTYAVTTKFQLENLQGYTRERVADYIEKHKLSARYPGDQYSERIPEGQVIEQYPPSGTELRKGDIITIIFSLGPEPKPDPEPVSTFIEFEVEVSDADQLVGTTYIVTITYKDSFTQGYKKYVEEQPITETRQYRVPVTIKPNEVAEAKVFLNGEEYQTHSKTYHAAVNEN